ncbi:ABC transporter ATP-binding protein [Leucothrix arctica]|uniref:ABC transporter ATP-binding protein n=1 Tax=Leucothrix arctica TaxID=1481894 RepID=A0A317C5E5_9GAMM|nr:ABC transporter ATP-binding protein [Leucothrix arctica]PWQ93517.1 ABC transporter ATP-binding protein [Leucothrix arctica]
MTEILKLHNLGKSFGAITVANELSFGLKQGEALGVLGPNGAGKTSMFNLITGTLKADKGTVTFDGKDVTRMSAADRCRAGIARSFQVPQPFVGMTVFENAMVAATQAADMKGSAAKQHCLEVLEQTELLHRANALAGTLTLLERKRLELTRALCAKPKLLLLDEIAGGLTEAECVSLISTIKKIHKSGVSIIWIEHVVHALLAVVDRLVVINFGEQIAEGDPDTVMKSKEVQEIYLGIDANG